MVRKSLSHFILVMKKEFKKKKKKRVKKTVLNPLMPGVH